MHTSSACPTGGRGSQRGQTAIIVALAFLVLVGFAGLAIDGGHVYLVHRFGQNATDAAALAAGKQLAAGGVRFGPLGAGDAAIIKPAHDVAYVNGFPTTYGTACTSSGTTIIGGTAYPQFSETWYDSSVPCGATSGFGTRVRISSPPAGNLSTTCATVPNYCVQVVITRKIDNFLMGVLGVPVTYSTTSATAFGQPPSSGLNVPPPLALYLYEPASGFSTSAAPKRQQLNCAVAGGNCPTFWVNPGTSPLIAGINAKIIPTADTVALESNGHMVIQDPTTICDPYGGAACSPGTLRGAKGFAIAAGGNVYCSGSNPLTLAPVPCTTTGPGGAALATLTGNETAFSAATWTPTVKPNGINCGTLVLNGGTVASGGANPACVNGSEPYTIMPGQYNYIVINHGTYVFDPGVFDIVSQAPVSGKIDHSAEFAADWDLCPGVTSCTATAGVWIGQSGPWVAGSTGTGACTGLGTQGGGGFDTVIHGSGVTFRFRGSAGLVSTHEVRSILLSAPGPGAALDSTGGTPLLFDLENGGFIHLDANATFDEDTGAAGGRFSGIIYQNPAFTSGGVELNPGLGAPTAAVAGQVLAYSFTTFGSPGTAIDFSQGYGASTTPVAVPNANAEPEIVGLPAPALKGNSPTTGFSQLIVNYSDEWALDAYNAYVQINNGSPKFFSTGMWQGTIGPTTPLPPSPNGGGVSDAPTQAAYPSSTQPGASNYTKATTAGGLPDWTYKFADGSSFEVSGNWTWGHEQDISGAVSGTNAATLTYTFPTPAGTTVNVTIYMSDGDHCGDFATISATFANTGTPAAGTQTAGSVRLEN